jgi:UDP-GlcNAc3NAcA epimerase
LKILTIIGARPQFIKAAVVSRAIAQADMDINEIVVHTGQHYDANMSAIFFEELDIPKPEYNLGIGGGSHGENTGRMLEGIERLMLSECPDLVLVYGDTDSTLAGALSAAKLHISIAHVEAGLRSYNRRMPEEINRIVTDHVADLLFAPTDSALENLRGEGIRDDSIRVVGDVMYDAAIHYRERARPPEWFRSLQVGQFLLCTIHRAENVMDRHRMLGILSGLGESPIQVVLPLHPGTRKRVTDMNLAFPPNVHVVEPVGYLEMVWLEMQCELVATDSGGIQKEAYFHGKRCVTFRDETEWVELTDRGLNTLVGADENKVVAAINSKNIQNFEPGIYGNGDSGRRIVAELVASVK